MEIEEQRNEVMSDSDDSWEPEEPTEQSENDQKPSLFKKIIVKFDDRIIEKNLDAECETPILNSHLFPFEDEEENEEMNCEETKSENPFQSEKIVNSEKLTMEMENEHQNSKESKFGSTENEEALFNVVEDEENESWMRKKVKASIDTLGNKNQERPLTCPQCFTQVCYAYELIKEQENEKLSKPITYEKKTEKKYKSKAVDNITVHEHKVIRNRFCAENMEKKANRSVEKLGEFFTQDLEIYENELKSRYEDINVKILISCEGCGLELGYWDVNQEIFILFNVI